MRKNLERQMVNLRGKTLNGDIAYKVTNSLQSMAKGDARGFREIMQNTPSRTLRRELVGTALRDMLSSGKRGPTLIHLALQIGGKTCNTVDS